MKKFLATVLLSSSFALCSYDPGIKVGGILDDLLGINRTV